MRPSKIAGAGAAGLGRQQIAVAGHAQHRAGHRIEHAAAMRVGDDDAVGIDRRLRLDRKFLHIAVGQHDADGFGFLRGRGGGGIAGRDQRAVDDAALRGAGAGAAGKRLQQPRGAARGGGRKLSSPISMVQAPLPTGMPASVASYCASSRPCAEAGLRRQQQATRRRTGRPDERSTPGEMALWMVTEATVLGSARAIVSFKQKYPANNALSAARPNRIGGRVGRQSPEMEPHDVGGELRRLYDGLKSLERLAKLGYFGASAGSSRNQAQNLDASGRLPLYVRGSWKWTRF